MTEPLSEASAFSASLLEKNFTYPNPFDYLSIFLTTYTSAGTKPFVSI